MPTRAPAHLTTHVPNTGTAAHPLVSTPTTAVGKGLGHLHAGGVPVNAANDPHVYVAGAPTSPAAQATEHVCPAIAPSHDAAHEYAGGCGSDAVVHGQWGGVPVHVPSSPHVYGWGSGGKGAGHVTTHVAPGATAAHCAGSGPSGQ